VGILPLASPPAINNAGDESAHFGNGMRRERVWRVRGEAGLCAAWRAKRTSLMRPSASDLCQVQTPGSWLDHMVPAARAPANMLAFDPDQPDIRRGGGWNS
jgi:hypothetical protein